MEQEQSTGESVPMDKQEIVKEDGRTLIYYTFPSSPDKTNDASQGGSAEAAHV